MKAAKKKREERRRKAASHPGFPLSPEEEKDLIRESQFQKAEYKRMERAWKEQIIPLQQSVSGHEAGIQALKAERKARSAALQQKLFEQFKMLNYRGEVRTLCDIFEQTAHKPLPQEPVSVPHPNYCSMPICMGGSPSQWQSSGGESRPKQKYGIMGITIPPAKANANLY